MITFPVCQSEMDDYCCSACILRCEVNIFVKSAKLVYVINNADELHNSPRY